MPVAVPHAVDGLKVRVAERCCGVFNSHWQGDRLPPDFSLTLAGRGYDSKTDQVTIIQRSGFGEQWKYLGIVDLYMCLKLGTNAYADQNFAGAYVTATCNSAYPGPKTDAEASNRFTGGLSCPSGYTGYLTLRNLALIDNTTPTGTCVGYMYVCYANWAM